MQQWPLCFPVSNLLPFVQVILSLPVCVHCNLLADALYISYVLPYYKQHLHKVPFHITSWYYHVYPFDKTYELWKCLTSSLFIFLSPSLSIYIHIYIYIRQLLFCRVPTTGQGQQTHWKTN